MQSKACTNLLPLISTLPKSIAIVDAQTKQRGSNYSKELDISIAQAYVHVSTEPEQL